MFEYEYYPNGKKKTKIVRSSSGQVKSITGYDSDESETYKIDYTFVGVFIERYHLKGVMSVIRLNEERIENVRYTDKRDWALLDCSFTYDSNGKIEKTFNFNMCEKAMKASFKFTSEGRLISFRVRDGEEVPYPPIFPKHVAHQGNVLPNTVIENQLKR